MRGAGYTSVRAELAAGIYDLLAEFGPERGHQLPEAPQPVITAITVTDVE